jgi:hypothetical protein
MRENLALSSTGFVWDIRKRLRKLSSYREHVLQEARADIVLLMAACRQTWEISVL